MDKCGIAVFDSWVTVIMRTEMCLLHDEGQYNLHSIKCGLKTNFLVSQLLIFFHLRFDGGDVPVGVCSSLVGVHERLAQTLPNIVIEAR